MYLTIADLTGTQQAYVRIWSDIASEAVSGFEKLVQLNFQALNDTAQRTMSALSTDTMHTPFQTRAGEPSSIERAALYNRQVMDILMSTQAAIARQATAHYQNQARAMQADFDEAAQRAPAGAQVAASALTAAMTATNSFYERIWKTARQAVETAESSVEVITRVSESTKSVKDVKGGKVVKQAA
jgi:hypothetical protein